MCFAIGFVLLFIVGALTEIFLGNSVIDIPLHDTYFVVANSHIVMGVAAFYGVFAGIYYGFPKIFGKCMNNTLGYIHFGMTVIGSGMIFLPMHYMMGMTGVTRRYYAFESFPVFHQYEGINQFISVFLILVFFAQLLLVVNFFYSIYKGSKAS